MSNLVISYYLCASEIWPDKKGDRFLLSHEGGNLVHVVICYLIVSEIWSDIKRGGIKWGVAL